MEHIFKEISNINEIAIQLARLEGDDVITHDYYSTLCDEIRTSLYMCNDLLVYAKVIMETIEAGLNDKQDDIMHDITRPLVVRLAKDFLKVYNRNVGGTNEEN